MAIVYQHLKKGSGEIFYIGIGKVNDRAYSKKKRNPHWHNVVNKHGYDVEILIENISWKFAGELETFLIAFYGRHDKGLGSLTNQTDGSDGSIGHIWSEDRKKIHSEKMKIKNPWSDPKIIESIRHKKIGKRRLDMQGENNISNRSDVKIKISIGIKNFLESTEGLEYKKNASERIKGINNPSKKLKVAEKIKNTLIEKLSKLNKNDRIKLSSHMNNKRIKCENCEIETNSGNYKRWHGVNCKKIK
jgi:hypothetical protein